MQNSLTYLPKKTAVGKQNHVDLHLIVEKIE